MTYVVIGDHVEIERPRTPVPLGNAVAAELVFDPVQREQQRVRIEFGLDLDCRIDVKSNT